MGVTSTPAQTRPRPATEARRQSEAVRFRRALTLVGMTLVLPGSAQLVAGNKQVGRVAIRIFLGLLAIAVLAFLFLDRGDLLGLAARTWFLSLVKFATLILGIGWLALFADAWRLARPRALEGNHPAIVSGVALALALVACAPLFAANYYANQTRALISSLFGGGGMAELADGRLNVLLLGGDAGKNRTGVRTDSITLASVDVESGKTVLIGLPRNLKDAPFPSGTPAADEFPGGFDDFLYGVYTYGTEHPELFPKGDDPGHGEDPGALAIKQAVSQILDIPVHYYALVEIAGFRGLIDALGGVTIRVTQRLPIGNKGEHLEPGLQKLDGYHAMWYARSRKSTSDYDRMSRQKCLMGAILREADPLTVLRNYEALAKSAEELVSTDIPAGALPRLVGIAEQAKSTKVTSLQLVPPLVNSSDPDFDRIHAKVHDVLEAARADEEKKDEGAKAPATKAPSSGSGSAEKKKSDPAALDEFCKYE